MPPPLQKKAFSLVLSLVIMALLLMLVMTLSTFLSLELGLTTAHFNRQKARLNALCSVRLALGHLQQTVGPDQRATAPLSILGENDTDSPNAHWVGVWRTDRLQNEKGRTDIPPFVFRDTGDGNLRDRRWSSGEEAAYVAKNELETVLVSRREPEQFPPWNQSLTEDEDTARLVGTGSVPAEQLATQGVLAPKIRLTDPTGNLTGKISWWAGDENTKARVNLRDPYPESNPASQRSHRLAPMIAGLGNLEGLEALQRSHLPGNDTRRAILASGSGLSLLGGIDVTTPKKYFHDTTRWSQSVLADMRNGGLKRDLTAFLLSESGEIPEWMGLKGLQDDDPMVDPDKETAYYANTAPGFGILRDWANLVKKSGGTVSATPLPQTPDKHPASAINLYHEGTNLSQVDLNKRTVQGIAPILTEAVIYYRAAYDPAYVEGSPTRLRFLIYPRVQLWNPYNVPLRLNSTFLSFRVIGSLYDSNIMTFTQADGTNVSVRFSPPAWPGLTATWGTFGFVLPGFTLQPGECRIFTAGDKRPYDARNPGSNLLTSEATSNSRYFYINDNDSSGGRAPFRGHTALNPVGATYRLSSCYEDNVDFKFKDRAEGLGSFAAARSLPMFLYMNYSENMGVLDTRHPDYNQQPMQLLSWDEDVDPSEFSRQGVRLRWINETESNRARFSPGSNVDVALLANYNLRFSTAAIYPYENLLRGQGAPNWLFHYIRDVPDTRVAWKNGVSLGNPFAGLGEWSRVDKFIAFDLPRRAEDVSSLAQFQHARVSEYPWHPSYPIGNSLISPHLYLNKDSSDVTSAPLRQTSSDWLPVDPRGWARRALQDYPEKSQLFYDQSYELNHTLFDRYFLSTGTAAEKDLFLQNPHVHPLPNVRLARNPHSSNTNHAAALKDYHQAAMELFVSGGFNVNTTSVAAWETLFASLRDVPVGSNSISGKTAFSRIAEPPGGEITSATRENDPNAHSGFKTLSDAEIQTLAERMVEEVKKRGPFLSFADFINRRLVPGFVRPGNFHDIIPPEYCGALEAALLRSKINAGMERGDTAIVAGSQRPGTKHQADHKAAFKTTGLPGSLTQADLLQTLAPVLTSRGDTFRIRASGETFNPIGGVAARAFVEVIVQRLPNPVFPDESTLNPHPQKPALGRRLQIVQVRWLSPDEV